MENVQTGEVETKYDCAINWQARYAREQIIKSIGIQQATESFRNEMVKSTQTTNNLMFAAMERKRLTAEAPDGD